MKRRRLTPRERFRYALGYRVLARISWLCWSSVVDWMLQADPERRKDIDPGEHFGLIRQREDAGALLRGVLGGASVEHCKSEARSCGSCYCGRFLRDDVYIEARDADAILTDRVVMVHRDYVPTWCDAEPVLRRSL